MSLLRGPARPIAISTLVNSVGTGLYVPTSLLYFTRTLGLSAAQVGLGLGIAVAAGLVLGTFTGHAADRGGPVPIYVAFLLVQGAAMAGYLLVHSFPMFATLAVIGGLADRGANAARGAIIASLGGGQSRAQLRAFLRSMTNVGLTVGAGLAAIALTLDTRAAYTAMIIGNAATFLVAAIPVLWIPAPPRVSKEAAASPIAALRDRPYLAATAMSGLMSLNFDILGFVLPLWVVTHTTAPRWIISVVVVINTLTVVLLQVRASRGTDDAVGAALVARRSGFALMIGCVLMALSGVLNGVTATVMILLFAVVHSFGEIWQAASGFGLSFALAPENAHGQYQATFVLGRGVVKAIAPITLTVVCLQWGTPGWLLLAGFFVVIGVLTPPVIRWAAATRTPAEADRVAVG